MGDSAGLRHGLGVDTAHLWSLQLTAPREILDVYASLLSADERERRARLLEGPIRDRFTIARGGLRILLGRYLERDPAAIQLEYGKRGKPRLAGAELTFNLAHSGELAVYAFAGGQELGVDIESLLRIPDTLQIARRFFAPEEFEALETLPGAQRVRAFYRAWTRKEAYVKAVGDGLHTPLDSFCVSLDSDETARLVTLNGSMQAASAWQLHHLDPAPGYVGALAYSGARKDLAAMEPFNPTELLSYFPSF
jgi:4'-phosphopantetheinyl transferase